MKHFCMAAAASVAMLAAAPAAVAAVYVNVGPVVDGNFTVTFGNTGIQTEAFNDVIDLNAFAIPWGAGEVNFVITSTMSTGSQNITFSDVNFNGANFASNVIGWNEFRTLNNVQVTGGSPKILTIAGAAGTPEAGANASYSGVITFAAAAVVPEPGAWALMILGFGGAGAMLRRNRQLVAA